eukprot:1394422-Amorphochlora_amoeboformis.AAC.1
MTASRPVTCPPQSTALPSGEDSTGASPELGTVVVCPPCRRRSLWMFRTLSGVAVRVVIVRGGEDSAPWTTRYPNGHRCGAAC